MTLFNDMMHKEIQVYVIDMVAKCRSEDEQLLIWESYLKG